MSEIQYVWPVIRQTFVFSAGLMDGDLFIRQNGYAYHAAPGQPEPLIYVVHRQQGRRIGRPDKTALRKPVEHVTAYGLDARGLWWRVMIQPDGSAKARTIKGAPYAKLGKSLPGARRRWRQPQWQATAAAAINAAMAAQLRASTGCDLI